jgi:hypothetical protein
MGHQSLQSHKANTNIQYDSMMITRSNKGIRNQNQRNESLQSLN